MEKSQGMQARQRLEKQVAERIDLLDKIKSLYFSTEDSDKKILEAIQELVKNIKRITPLTDQVDHRY